MLSQHWRDRHVTPNPVAGFRPSCGGEPGLPPLKKLHSQRTTMDVPHDSMVFLGGFYFDCFVLASKDIPFCEDLPRWSEGWRCSQLSLAGVRVDLWISYMLDSHVDFLPKANRYKHHKSNVRPPLGQLMSRSSLEMSKLSRIHIGLNEKTRTLRVSQPPDNSNIQAFWSFLPGCNTMQWGRRYFSRVQRPQDQGMFQTKPRLSL